MSSMPPVRPPLTPDEVGPPTFTTPAYREPTEVTDARHLNLLSTFHYVLAAMTGLFALFPIIHLVMGIIMLSSPATLSGGPGGSGGPPPQMLQLMGGLFALLAAFFILLGLTTAVLLFSGGRCLARRTHHTWCLIVAGVACLQVPLGTILGIFTIIVLLRPSVKNMFEVTPATVVPDTGKPIS